MHKRIRTIFQYFLFTASGIFFAWLSLKNLNKDNIEIIQTAISRARHWLVAPVFVILLLSHYVRAVRWQLLIEPLGYKPSGINTFFAVMIGYIVNQGVPRFGELVKCTVLSRYEKISVEKLIGTIILERFIDAICLLIIFAITLGLQPDLYNKIVQTFFYTSRNPNNEKTSFAHITAILAGVLLITFFVWIRYKRKSLQDMKRTLRNMGLRLAEGIVSIRRLQKRNLFISLTIMLWSLYFLGGYLGFIAFRETEHYGIKEAFTVLSAGSIGMIASPGGLGAYAYLIEKTMILYGLHQPVALAFGWILWLATTAVIVIGGLISFVAIPIYNKNKNLEKAGTDTA